MLFKLLVTAILALGAVGIIVLLNKLTKGRIPKIAMPLAVVGAIIGYQIFDDYNWHGRKVVGLQQAEEGEFVIVGEYKSTSFARPWTYIKAPTTRIDAVNVANNKPVVGSDGVFENFIGTTNQFGRASLAPFYFDCQNANFAPNTGDVDTAPWGPMPKVMFEGLCQ